MKKIISVLLLIFAASMMYAQDIIVTTNEQKIEAKVIEISSTQIKYLVANMPDGPVFVLETNEVASILFANGQVKVFDNQYRKSVVMLPNNKEAYLYRLGNMYYYGGAVMRDNQYAQFLQRNCTEAYEQYQNGHSIATAGWCLFGVGLGVQTLVLPWLAIIDQSAVSSLILGVTSFATLLSSVPTLGVGYHRMHRSAEIFNIADGSNAQVYWSVNASQNGVGVALNF